MCIGMVTATLDRDIPMEVSRLRGGWRTWDVSIRGEAGGSQAGTDVVNALTGGR